MNPLYAALSARRVFIVYKAVPREGGKLDKIPVDPATGANSNAQDPATQMLPGMALAWATSLGAPYGVGIVINEGSGLFCLDLDGHVVGGIRSAESSAVIEPFAGAYIETSVSGTGLHVIGSYSGAPPIHGTRNHEMHAELYTKARFIALTDGTGDVLKDCSDALWSLAWRFPKSTVEGSDNSPEWSTEFDPACTITGSIEERIAFLRKTKSFAARLNSRKVTFEDLYTANEVKLSQAWPGNNGKSYDASSADQAFVNHLAFGFGNNCDAIEQFMLATDSPLHRAKWDERPDYRRATILKAVAIPKQWKRTRTSAAPSPARAAVSIQPSPGQPIPAPLAEAPVQEQQPSPLVAPPPPGSVPPPPAVFTPALPVMLTNSKGLYEATLDTVRRTLESDGMLSFDDFRNEPMMQHGVVRLPMTDKDYIDLRTLFEREKNFAAVGKELMRDAVLAEAQRRRYDSGIEWLTAQVWDGVPRVERFMSTHFGAADDEYTRAVGRYMWTGLAGRIFEPGCQLDMVIALQSKQGTGKSTGLKALAPDPEYFTDGLSLHEDNDNFKRLMRGKVIVEIAELAGLSKGDINVVKRVITRTTEKWIEKYQTAETSYSRRCMLFASTNETEFLPPDETGQRRWLPVVITEINRPLVTADRAQLWAEGAAIWRATGIAYSDAERLAAGRHKAHEQTDVWEARIAEWLVTTPPTGQAPYLRALTIAEVLEGAIRMQSAHMDTKAEKRAGRVLRALGYVSKSATVGGQSVRRWALHVPPPPQG